VKVERQKAERECMKNVYATVEMKYWFQEIDFVEQRAVDAYIRKYVEIDLEVIEWHQLVYIGYIQV
jgi:hypothetical protein